MEKTDNTPRWQKLLFGSGEVYIINVYSVIALLAATIFGVLHFLRMFVDVNTTVGAMEVTVGVVVFINMIALRIHHNIVIARNILLAAVLVLMEALIVSGGTQKTGIFWLFTFPVATFFLVGIRQGRWWLAMLYTLVIATTLCARFSLLTIPYSPRQIYQLLISLSVVTLGVYIYQHARENALREIEASQRDLQEFLDQMPTYNIKVGVDGVIIFANKQAKESSGLGEHLIGSQFLDGRAWTSNEEARKRTEQAFHEAVAGKTVSYDEKVSVDSPEGSQLLTVNFTLLPVIRDGRLRYVLVEARDVSSEREAAHTKNEFVSIATGQLRPSVAAITEATERLRNPSVSLPEDTREIIDQIRRNNQQIHRVVNNMLLVSGLELGNLPVNLQKFNLADVSGSVVEALRTVYLKDRKLQIEEDYGANMPQVAVDFELFGAVLYDLILNAIKFTPDGGQIHIRISQVEQKLTPESQGSIQIEVQDTGLGIPENEQKLVFTKSFQAKNAQKQGGSGQSLYIIKKLLDYVGGTITFMSKENVGTIFVVMLPVEGMNDHKGS